MIRTLAALAVMVSSSDVRSCSGVIKQDVDGTNIFETVHRGDVLVGLEQAVRDAVTGSVIVCGRKCYPAIGRFEADDGPMAEIIELHGCTVGKMLSDIEGVERYALDDNADPHSQ